MRIIVMIFGLLALTACANWGPAYLGAVDGTVVMGTDKTIIDHGISLASGKDCSSVRLEQGKRYCKEDDPVIRPDVYCYRTLADVTCYDRPDPSRQQFQMLGQGEHNLNVQR